MVFGFSEKTNSDLCSQVSFMCCYGKLLDIMDVTEVVCSSKAVISITRPGGQCGILRKGGRCFLTFNLYSACFPFSLYASVDLYSDISIPFSLGAGYGVL